MYPLQRWVWVLIFSEEMLTVMPHCVAGPVVAAVWGEEGTAGLPAAGLLEEYHWSYLLHGHWPFS